MVFNQPLQRLHFAGTLLHVILGTSDYADNGCCSIYRAAENYYETTHSQNRYGHFRSGAGFCCCTSVFKYKILSLQTVAECLCAIMFLEDTSPRQVFNEFLLARQVF